MIMLTNEVYYRDVLSRLYDGTVSTTRETAANSQVPALPGK
jgi:hypothetical protein